MMIFSQCVNLFADHCVTTRDRWTHPDDPTRDQVFHRVDPEQKIHTHYPRFTVSHIWDQVSRIGDPEKNIHMVISNNHSIPLEIRYPTVQRRAKAEDPHVVYKAHGIPCSTQASQKSDPEKKIRTQYPMIIECHIWYPVSEAHTGNPPSEGGSSSHRKVTVAITVNITISNVICHRWGDQGKSQGTHCVVPPSQLLVKPACTLPRAQKADLLPTAKWRLLSLSSPYVDQGETETKTNIKPGGPREAVPPSQPSSSTTVSHHPKFTVSHVRPKYPREF